MRSQVVSKVVPHANCCKTQPAQRSIILLKSTGCQNPMFSSWLKKQEKMFYIAALALWPTRQGNTKLYCTVFMILNS